MNLDDVIARRPKGRAGALDWYREAFEAQRAAGLSVGELAARLNKSATVLYSWRRRVGIRRGMTDEPKPEKPRASLVQVQAAPRAHCETAATPATHFGVRLANARSIRVPVGFDSEALRELIATLESC